LKFKPHLRFEDVSVKFLYEYEQWMLAKGNGYTSIGIYTRNMRAIFNNQIADGLLHPRYYPFGKRKYQVSTGANVKKALELSDLKKLYDYEPNPENKNEGFARDMWFFGYYSNGINPRDIANLKYKNIDDGFIQLRREKTKFTTRANPKTITIPVNEDMQVIIDRWGDPDKDPENYIFPVLIDNISAHRRYELVQGFLAIINDWMKVIAKKVGIKKRITTMTWRHTYATVMKRSGISSEFIKEALGHTDLKTTENYLDSFELEIKKKYSTNLMAFKDVKEAAVM
jgi:integrase